MKLVRKGCARCGRWVVALDDARYRVRLTVGMFTRSPNDRNRDKAEQARHNLEQIKRQHDAHMIEHEEETCERI